MDKDGLTTRGYETATHEDDGSHLRTDSRTFG